jgi:hypothetical protein
MMASLSPADLRKLIGILGRLGSDFDGERAAAGLLASRLIRAAGLGWDDLLTAPKTQQASGRTQSGHGPWSPDGDSLTLCLKWLGELSPWETRFVMDLRQKRRLLTPAQRAKLEQIADGLRARGLS